MKQINPHDIVSALTVVEETKNQEQEWADRGFGCPECDGYGNVITDDGARYCECKTKYFIKKSITECGVPVHLFKIRTLLDYNFDGVISIKDWLIIDNFAEKYSPKNNKGLLLWGGNGTGKSHIAIALTHQLLLRRVSVKYVSATQLIYDLKNSFRRDATDTEYEILERLLEPTVLVIDDLMISGKSDWQRDTFFYLIDKRYTSTRSTLIITTNLPFLLRPKSAFPQFVDEAGPRITSRLGEMCHDIEFTGDDHRARPTQDAQGSPGTGYRIDERGMGIPSTPGDRDRCYRLT